MKYNNIKRRFTAMLSAFAMILSLMCVPAFAADNTDVRSTEKGLLRAVGVLPEKDLATEYMSRADFAVYTARVIGINDFEQNETRYFYDVPMNHYALNSINKLVDLKVLSMDGDKEFRPDDIITFDEACKILVSALGYDDMAKVYGGYPGGYLSVANRLDISKGISGGDLTTSNAIYMLYNALKADVQDIISVSTEGTKKKANGETALSVYHNISFAEGTLTATDGQTMYGDLNPEKGQTYIDDTRYDSNVDLTGLFGSYVQYYYKKNANDTNEIVYAEELNDKTVMIDTDDFSRYDNGTIYYNKNDRETSVSTSDGRVIVYNGRPISTDIDNTFNNLNYGTITIKQSKNKGNDLIIIEDYTDMYVSAVSKNMESISDSKLSNSVIEVKKWETLVFKTEDGTAVEYTDIPNDTILAVKKSKDNKLIYGRISTTIASGAIARMFEDGGETTIVIDNTEYKMTKACAAKFKSSLKLGSSYKYYFNPTGKIAYIDTTGGTNMVPGYLTNAIKNDDSFDNNLKIRLLAENGKRVVYETADKVKIDGVEYTDPDKIIAAFPSDSGDKTKVEPQLIMYKLSGEKIKEIDTYGGDPTKEDKKNTLERCKPQWNEVHYFAGRFGWKIPVRSGGKLFTVPSNDNINSASDKKFSVQTTSGSTLSLISGKNNNVFYRLGTDSAFYDYAVSVGDATYSLNEACLTIVTDIFETLDDEEQIVTAISVLAAQKGGSPVNAEYKINEGLSIDGLEKGDVIRCAYSGDAIMDYELLYDESSNDLPDKFPGSNWKGVTDYWNLYQEYTYYGDAFQLSFGYVNSKKDDMLRWGYKSPQVADEVWYQYISSSTGGSRIMIWDTEQEKAYVGTLDDVIDYETYGKGSRVILQTCWSEFRAIVVYI